MILAVIFLPSLAQALQPLITDDTGTIGQGRNQAEFSVSRDRESSPGDGMHARTVAAVYTRGLSDNLDIYFGTSHISCREHSTGNRFRGQENPVTGVKWRFYENAETGNSLVLKPELALPVSERNEAAGLGSGKASAALMAVLTHEVGFGAIHVNLGAGRERYRDPASNPDVATSHVSVAPVWDVSPQWKLVADLGTRHARAGGIGERTNFLELGAIYAPDEDLEFAFGLIRQTATGDIRTTSATAGITWRFD